MHGLQEPDSNAARQPYVASIRPKFMSTMNNKKNVPAYPGTNLLI